MALNPFGGDNFPRLHLHDFMRDFNRVENDLYRQLVNDDKKFAVNLNVSQFRPDELKVHIEGHQLTIEGKQEHKDEHSHSQRSFVHSFTLPADVNLEAIRSHLSDDGHLSVEAPKLIIEDGHLSVEAPKAGHALQHKKQIPIQVDEDEADSIYLKHLQRWFAVFSQDPAAELQSRAVVNFDLLSDDCSFWSIVYRVTFEWNKKEDRERYPNRMVLKFPHISENVQTFGNIDALGMFYDAVDYEMTFYELFGNQTIPHFPKPRFYYGSRITGGDFASGSLLLEDFADVRVVDCIPGYSIAQVYRLMDALAGMHHFLMTDSVSLLPYTCRSLFFLEKFQDAQFGSAMGLKTLHPDIITGDLEALRPFYGIAYAKQSHDLYNKLGMKPVLVHFDMNTSNLLWRRGEQAAEDDLVAVIDYQQMHIGCIAEDMVRIFCLGLSVQDRRDNEDKFFQRYHDTISQLFNGNPPFELSKVRECYENIFNYASNFTLFGISFYHNMYNRLVEDEVQRAPVQEELARRCQGVIEDMHRYADVRRP